MKYIITTIMILSLAIIIKITVKPIPYCNTLYFLGKMKTVNSYVGEVIQSESSEEYCAKLKKLKELYN